MAEPTWDEMVGGFVDRLRDQERSDHTIRNYRSDLALFAAWYRGQYDMDPDPAKLAKRHLLDWSAQLAATGGMGGGPASVPTQNRKLSAVRSFFRYLDTIDKGVRFDPPRPRKRQGRPDHRWLEVAEERALLSAVEVGGKARDLALVYLSLHGGLRLAEAVALNWEDITISERKGELIVRKGKGCKERTVKLSMTLRHALLDWGAAGGGHRRKGPVLTGQRGRLSWRGVEEIVGKYARAARVGGRGQGIKDFTHHCLRHTCARRMLDKGVKVPEVAAHLGHADIKTTMGYLTSRDEDLAAAAKALD